MADGDDLIVKGMHGVSLALSASAPIGGEFVPSARGAWLRESRGPHTEITRAKMRAAWKSRPPLSQETRKRIAAALTGRVMSEEAKRKISASNTGRKRTAEQRQRMSEAQRRRHREKES